MVQFIEEYYLLVRHKDMLMTVLGVCMSMTEPADKGGEPFSVFKEGRNMGIQWTIIGET